MSDRTRRVRQTPVSESVARLSIEPLLVHPGDDPLAVMHVAAERPQTRVLGVVDEMGVLVGVLSTVRLAEAVIVRVSPETLLAEISDLADAARFGHTVSARTVGDVMLPPATIGETATIDEAFRRMHARHLSGLYVVDAAGRPTGYLDLLELTMRYVEALEADFDEGRLSPAMEVVLAGVIFAVTYAFIATDRIDKTIAALLGGSLVVILGLVSQEEAFGAIDLNVILLLTGMMIMAGILRRTGFFGWLAIRSVKVAGGDPFRLLVVLSIVCGFLSAFLDNVTTVVLIAPVTLYIASVLRVSPVPFLISLILASNIGGTATLIGDPPNILIGSAADLGFEDFLLNMAPVAILIFVVFLGMTRVFFARDFAVHAEVRDAVLALDEEELLTDRRLLRISLAVIAATMVGFVLARPFGLEAGTIALFGAAVLALAARLPSETVLEEVEWSTLFFFVGLFMLVAAIVHVGIVDAVAAALIDITGGDATVTTLGLIWLSGIASAIIDNIPYTATMIPVVQELGASGMPIEPLWWALALGACLGGNATIVGASANVVVANLAGRAGEPITFRAFMRYGIPVTVMSLAIATGYVYLRYL